MRGGQQAAATTLRSIEQEAINSQRRINAEIDKSARVMERYEQQLDRLNKRSFETNKLNREIARGGFAGTSNADIARMRQQAAEIDRINAASRRAAGGMGMFGQAFKGAFVGAIAGMAFSTLIEIPRKFAEVGIAAVRMAGEFQMSVNAMTLFTGSTRLARAELSQLDELARNTPGLRLEDAQVGATRLRALGFEAQLAQNLVVGIAKQKLISGVVDETAIQRVLVNLQQLKAGSPQIQRDIQQMVLSIPSLSIEIEKAFGGIEKFKQALRRDPGAALDVFAKSLADAEAPAGGLLNAWEKLEDEFIRAGRTFGEPILDRATESIVKLTGLVANNADTWASWGQDTADAFYGAEIAARAFYQYVFGMQAQQGSLQNVNPVNVIAPIPFGALTELGEALRKQQEAQQRANISHNLSADSFARIPGKTGFESVILGKDFTWQTTNSEEAAAVRRQAELKAADETERRQREEIESLKTHHDEVIGAIKDRYSIEEALAERTTKEVGALRSRALLDEINEQRKYYDRIIALNIQSGIEDQKLISERNQTLNRLQAELVVNELETARKVQKERLAAQKDFNDLSLRQIDQNLDAQTYLIERAIDRQETSVSDGYTKLAQIEQDAYSRRRSLIEANYQIEIQNKTLTTEQLKNLEIEKNLDIEQLTNEHNQRLLELQDRQHEKLIDRLTQESEQIGKMYAARITLFTNFQNTFLRSDLSFGRGISPIQTLGIFGREGGAEILSNIQKVMSGNMSMYEAQLDMLTKIHRLETANLTREIKLNDDLIKLERFRQKAQIETALLNLDILNRRVLKEFEGATDEGQRKNLEVRQKSLLRDIEYYQGLLGKLQSGDDKQIAEANAILDSQSEATKRYTNNIQELDGAMKNLQITQAGQKKDLWESQAEGLKELYKQITEGQKDNIIRQLQENNLWNERVDLAVQLKFLQAEANGENNDALKIQVAYWQKIVDLRNEEVNAVIRIQSSQLDINRQLVYSRTRADADLMEFFARQKGVTELLSDARINLITKAYDGLDVVIGKLTKRFGVFGDVVKELLSGLIKLALNQVFQRLFIGGGGGGQGGGWQNIFGGFGGGGIGGTPSWNPNARGNFWSAATGGGFGGGGMQINPWAIGGQGGGGIGLGGFILPGGASNTILHEGGHAGSAPGGRGLGLSGGIGIAALAATLIGGAMGGVAGSALQYGGMGAMVGLQFGGPLGAGIGALIGLIGGGLFGFFSKMARRRKEERLRERAMGDAFRAMDKLIDDVNSDRIEGAAALDQAETIRSNYLSSMSQLTDRKTRDHALRDVSRIDQKIEQLKTAVAGQTSRRQRLELYAPTFGDGGSMSRFARENFQFNPLGYQRGGERIGYFPASGQYARFNERGAEYIFDAETTRNIGEHYLDQMRHSKGQMFRNMLSARPVASRADGGSLFVTNTTTAPASTQAPVINVTINIDGSAISEAIAESIVVAIRANNGSPQQTTEIAKSFENKQANKLGDNIAQYVMQKLGLR